VDLSDEYPRDVHDLLLLSRGPEGPPRRRSSSAPASHPLNA